MDNRCNIFSKRNNTYVCTCVHSCFCYLITDTTNQCYQNTLCLIRFNQCHTFFNSRSGAKNNCNTRNISCYKRNTQFTDHCITQMSIQWLFIWCCPINIFQSFDKFCAKCGSNTGHKCVIQTRLSCHQSFNNSQSFFQFFQVCYFYTCNSVITRQAVCCIREADCFIFAMLCDSCINSLFCKTIYSVISIKYSLK